MQGGTYTTELHLFFYMQHLCLLAWSRQGTPLTIQRKGRQSFTWHIYQIKKRLFAVTRNTWIVLRETGAGTAVRTAEDRQQVEWPVRWPAGHLSSPAKRWGHRPGTRKTSPERVSRTRVPGSVRCERGKPLRLFVLITSATNWPVKTSLFADGCLIARMVFGSKLN